MTNFGEALRLGYRQLREDLQALDRLQGSAQTEAFVSVLTPSRRSALALVNVSLEAHEAAQVWLRTSQEALRQRSGPELVLETQDVVDRIRVALWWMTPEVMQALFRGRYAEQFLAASEFLELVVLGRFVPWILAVAEAR